MDEAIEASEPEPEHEDTMPPPEEYNEGNKHPLSQFGAQQLIEMMDHMTGLKKSFDLLVKAFENYKGEAVAGHGYENENNEDVGHGYKNNNINENHDPDVNEIPEEGEESNGK